MDHAVIDRPESVEVKHLLVPRDCGLHFHVGLVANAVVNEVKLVRLHDLVVLFLEVVNLESWQEGTGVVNSLNKGVDGVAVGLHTGNND